MTSDLIFLKFNSSRVSHSASSHGKRSVGSGKNLQVRIGSSRRMTSSPVHTQNAAILYACVPVYARLWYVKLNGSNSSRRFPICTAVRLRSRSWCSHWTPSDCPVSSRRSLRHVPSRPVECELGLNCLQQPFVILKKVHHLQDTVMLCKYSHVAHIKKVK